MLALVTNQSTKASIGRNSRAQTRVSIIEYFQLTNNRRSFLSALAPIACAHAARALGEEPSKMGVRTRQELILLDAPTETQFLPEIEVNSGRKHIS